MVDGECTVTSSKKIRIAINGFGRIGRCIVRAISEHPAGDRFELVAINDLADFDVLAHLLAFDSTHGRWPHSVHYDGNHLEINGHRIPCFAESRLEDLPWTSLAPDLVIECAGKYKTRDALNGHLEAGATRVLASYPVNDADATVVYGVNHAVLGSEQQIVSNASCTTNCLAPLAKVIHENYGITKGLMSTVHAVTATQQVVDGPSMKDWRGGRGACFNIIPSGTGAAKAVGKVLPELNGVLTGMAFRVPTCDVSVVDLTVTLAKGAPYAEICETIKAASEGPLKGVLAYTDEEVVSTDFIGDPHTSIFDAKAGIALDDNFVKLVSWYDNEWGYSNKILDLVKKIA